MVSDVIKSPPFFILVENTKEKRAFRGSNFDYLGYFLQSPDFDSLFQAYELSGSLGDFDIYKRRE